MMTYFKHTILCVATALLLLHNFTPHQHHGEMAEQGHRCEHRSGSFFDLLRTVFHNNMGGQHHLENIRLEKEELALDSITGETPEDKDDFFAKSKSIKNQFQTTFQQPFLAFFAINTSFTPTFYRQKRRAKTRKNGFYVYKNTRKTNAFTSEICLRGPPCV